MEKLPIGTKIFCDGKERTILAYSQTSSFLVDGFDGGHYADSNTWYDENGNEIPYVKGDNDRWWFSLSELSECTILSKKEPDFIFGL